MTHTKFTIAALGLVFAATTSMAHAASINEAMASAINTHPEILAAQKDQAAIGHRIDMARAGYKPKVDVAFGAGWENSNGQVRPLRIALPQGPGATLMPRASACRWMASTSTLPGNSTHRK